jgi:glycosyltransferase involved in cell wall biosynthesis
MARSQHGFARVPRRVVMVAGLGFVFIDADRGTSAKARVLKAVVNSLYWLAFRLSHRVIFQNPDDFELMVESGIAPRDRAMLVDGSGVNLDRFPLRTTPRDAQRRLTFIWMGRLLREKGVVELVEATKIVREQGFDVEVLLVGGVDSNPGSLTEATVQGWHEAGVITWTGKVDDVRPYLAQSDVFVLPSYREGLPRSTQEAMAMGLAVITTDVPGCRETVVNGVNGMLVPVRSAPAIADAMIRYAREPGLAAQHAAAGRALVKRKFDVRVINRHMREALIGAQPT